MVKITPANPAPNAFPRVEGGVLVRDTKHGIVAGKWPRKRGKAKSGYDFYRQVEFGIASAWAADAEATQLKTAMNMVEGTLNVPRDLLIMASMGTFWTFIMPDGTVKRSWRVPNPNPQLVLDMISDGVGSILYRAPIGWVALPPGNAGQMLAIVNNAPVWIDPPQTPGIASNVFPTFWESADTVQGPLTTNSSANFTTTAVSANVLYLIPMVVPAARTFTSIKIPVTTFNAAGNTARLGIYNHSQILGGPSTLLVDGGTVATTTNGIKSATINKLIQPGPIWLAMWFSAACTLRGIGAGFMVATSGNYMTTTNCGGYNYCQRSVAYAGAFPDESGQTHTTPNATGTTPMIGLR